MSPNNLTATVEKFSLIADAFEGNIFANAERALTYYMGLGKPAREKLRETETFTNALRAAYNSQRGRPVEMVNSNLLAQVLLTLPLEERKIYK